LCCAHSEPTDDEALAGADVLVPHRAVLLLAGRVEDVEEAGLAVVMGGGPGCLAQADADVLHHRLLDLVKLVGLVGHQQDLAAKLHGESGMRSATCCDGKWPLFDMAGVVARGWEWICVVRSGAPILALSSFYGGNSNLPRNK
jgi:hypothetical protein